MMKMTLYLILKRLAKNHRAKFLKVILVQPILKDIKIYQKKIEKLLNRDSNNYCKLFKLIITLQENRHIFNLKKKKFNPLKLKKTRMKMPIY